MKMHGLALAGGLLVCSLLVPSASYATEKYLPSVEVNAPPKVSLASYDRVEFAPVTMKAPFEGQKPNVAARERIQEMEKREAEQADKHHRLLADFANYRNRVARDIQLAVDLSERKLLLEILPVLDNFERCIGSSYMSVEDFRNGVELIQKQFLDALRRVGVEGVKLDAGDPFDAQHAEALSTTHNPELQDGAVAAIYERGFMLREKLLRAAKVVVNHHPS